MTLKTNELTRMIIGSAIEVHRHLGPGLLESVYETCLEYELKQQGLMVERQVELPVTYKNIQIDQAYRIDLWVNKHVILELKSIEKIHPVHEAQILSYLKLSKCTVGLLLNFNVKMMKDGISRYAM